MGKMTLNLTEYVEQGQRWAERIIPHEYEEILDKALLGYLMLSSKARGDQKELRRLHGKVNAVFGAVNASMRTRDWSALDGALRAAARDILDEDEGNELKGRYALPR